MFIAFVLRETRTYSRAFGAVRQSSTMGPMSWASRRRGIYLSGVILFFVIVIGLPAAYWWISSIPPACAPGTMRPTGQTSGPCAWLDTRYLQPLSIEWA